VKGGVSVLGGLTSIALLVAACTIANNGSMPAQATLNTPYTTGPTVACHPRRWGDKLVGDENGYQVWQVRQVGTDNSGMAQILYAIRVQELPCAFEVVSRASAWQLANSQRSLSVVPLGAWLEFGQLNAEMQREVDAFSADCKLHGREGQYCGASAAGVSVLASNGIGGQDSGKLLIINGVVFDEESGKVIARMQ
jgi:hypothetical protein